MKTLKVMSIIGLVFATLCLFCIVAFNNPYDFEASVGWGVYLFLWTVAFSIVVLVQAGKNKKS